MLFSFGLFHTYLTQFRTGKSFEGNLVKLASRHYVSLQSSAKSRKTDEVNSTKYRKPHFWLVLSPSGLILARFRPVRHNFGPECFFSRIRLCHFCRLPERQLCKKSEKSNDGKYKNFCHGLTERKRRRARFIRTRCPSRRVLKSTFLWYILLKLYHEKHLNTFERDFNQHFMTWEALAMHVRSASLKNNNHLVKEVGGCKYRNQINR